MDQNTKLGMGIQFVSASGPTAWHPGPETSVTCLVSLGDFYWTRFKQGFHIDIDLMETAAALLKFRLYSIIDCFLLWSIFSTRDMYGGIMDFF